jgi:hypothetical protein
MIEGGGGLAEDASEQQQLPTAFEPQEATFFRQQPWWGANGEGG